jgi:LysM repeat protein
MPLGLPHVPRVWLGVVAVLVAALVLFLAPTLLPGLFGAQPLATPAPAPSVAPSVSIAPTPPPLPTPFVYTVVRDDTLSGIAARYGLTVPELMKANPQIKNENKLGIGDRLTIPVSGASSGGSGVTAAPSGLAAP